MGINVKIGKHNKVDVLATVIDMVGEDVVAYCNHFQKPYYLSFKLEDLNEDYEVLDYVML